MYFRVKITLKNNYHYTNKQLSKFDSNSIQITKQIKFLFFWTKKKESNFFGYFGFFSISSFDFILQHLIYF
jgi:citrate lyase synthetase